MRGVLALISCVHFVQLQVRMKPYYLTIFVYLTYGSHHILSEVQAVRNPQISSANRKFADTKFSQVYTEKGADIKCY
jgi:hypothetical protein